ncbi:MAG: cation:proton antiporter [Alphaproteobacteria bacterium]|nr:MAG: cation:proton antiporter [Alphaproteobacteria bacterium]
MQHGTLYHDIIVFLLAAVVVVSIFRWLKASPILGYLIAGTAIGPYSLGFISQHEGAQALGEFGVIFLMFVIGLKMPMQRLKILRRYVFGLGMLQVFVTALLFTGVLHFWAFEINAAIIIACGMSLSSTAVVLQVLAERGESASRFGRVSFSILLFQDLAVVLFLMMLSVMGQDQGDVLHLLGAAILRAILALVGIILIGRTVLRPIFRWIASLENQELFVIATLLLVVATGALTHQAGLSMEMGAFLAGLLLSETEYRHQVEADIQPFHGLLLGLFFMAVGMTINLRLFAESPFLITGLVLALMVTKIFLIYALCIGFRLPHGSALRSGMILAGGGEFVFVLFNPSLEKGIITADIAAVVYLVVLISMALTPLMASLGRTIESRLIQKEADSTLNAAVAEIEDLRNHIIIIGFGRVGRLLCKLFTERMIPYVAIDNHMSKVTEGRAQGYPVFFGDGRRSHVLQTLSANKASGVVVSLDSPSAALRACLMVRRSFPHANVFVRMRNDDYYEKLTNSGVYVAMPENLEPSLKLATAVLRTVGVPVDETTQIVDDFRKAYNTTLDDEEKPATT